MSKKKKILVTSISALFIIGIGAFFAIPIIAQQMIREALEVDGTKVETISIGWSGPQIFRGVHYVHNESTADLDIEIDNGLLSLLINSKPIKAAATGDATIVIPMAKEAIKNDAPPRTRVSIPQQKKPFAFPKLDLTLSLPQKMRLLLVIGQLSVLQTCLTFQRRSLLRFLIPYN